jgi:hypothetical protein
LDERDRSVERYVLTACIKPGAKAAAEQLLEAGPPFDPAEVGLSAHAAYLDDERVYLVFEGDGAHAKALTLARKHMVEVARWQSVIRDLPSTVTDVSEKARCLYRWESQP